MKFSSGRYGLAALALYSISAPPSLAQEMAKPATEMQAVLDKLGALEAKPFSTSGVPEARTPASPADAAKAVQWGKHAAMLALLKGASEQDFQPLYIEMQTTTHMGAVTLFTTYAKGGDDEAVKVFAAKTLPKLEMHKTHVMHLVASH